MKILIEFKQFAVKGNVVDIGVGLVIGAAFTSIVNSLVKDVFTPFIALLTTGVNFSNWFYTLRDGDKGGPYATLLEAQADKAVTINIGAFVNALISFLVVAIVLFFIIRTINKLKTPPQVTVETVPTRECPYCYSVISVKATRCPACTSQLDEQS